MRHALWLALALSFVATSAGAQRPAERVACRGLAWRNLWKAIEVHCREGSDPDCRDRRVLPACDRGHVTIEHLGRGRLRIQPDCWSWIIELAAPRPRPSVPRPSIVAHLRAGWRVSSLRLDVSRCD